jgi:hypothetical protein
VGVFRSKISDGKIIDFNYALMKKLGFNDPIEFAERFHFTEYYVDKNQRQEFSMPSKRTPNRK